jgi:hypothetical protein
MRRTRALAAVAALIALVLLGALWSSGRGQPPPARDDDGALRAELARLALAEERTLAVLERLEQALAGLTAPVPEERRAVSAAPPPSLDELVASLDALRATIEAETRRTQELIRDAPAFGGESLQSVRERNAATDWTALDRLESDWRTDGKAVDRSQQLQSPRDLLRAYGPPSAIYRPQGGMLFVYRRHAEGQSGPAHYFRLQEGMVIEYWVEDEKVEQEADEG